MRLRTLAFVLAISACKGPESPPKAPEPAPVAAAPAPAPAPSLAPSDVPPALTADFTVILSKYQGLALEACTCKGSACYERLRAKSEAELVFDRPKVAAGADEAALKAVLEKLYGCEPKTPPIAAPVVRPDSREPAEEIARPETRPELPKRELSKPEAVGAEAVKPEAAKPELPKPPPGDPLAVLPSVPGGDVILDVATRLGDLRMAQVFGTTMAELRKVVPECRRDDDSDLRPYVTSCSWKTGKKDPKSRAVRAVMSFYDGKLHQLAVQHGQDHADLLRRVDAEFGVRAPTQPKPGEDGLGTTATLWRPSSSIVIKVREKRGHRTLVVADGTRYDDFRQHDDAASRAERLNGEAVALNFQYPRAVHVASAEKKLRAAIALVPEYRLAQLHLCQLLWLARGDIAGATAACSQAQKSKIGTLVADALLNQGLMAMGQARHAEGRELLGKAVKTDARDDQPKKRAQRVLALHEGNATKKQVEALIAEIACARADSDKARAERLVKATGISERQLSRIASSLGVGEQALTARDLGLCPKPPE